MEANSQAFTGLLKRDFFLKHAKIKSLSLSWLWFIALTVSGGTSLFNLFLVFFFYISKIIAVPVVNQTVWKNRTVFFP